MRAEDRHFACTQCGACCDRSPEVELSEAAGLADQFVFQLMFRVYPANAGSNLKAFAALKLPSGGRSYLTISALSVDGSAGRCSALIDRRCSIYARRPLSCRSVPLHYSMGGGRLTAAFDTFVATPQFDCDTGPAAPAIVSGGRIADPQIGEAREKAVALSRQDKGWKAAIIDRMTSGQGMGLPSLEDVVANASYGATVTSMRLAWDILVEQGSLGRHDRNQLLRDQIEVIDHQLGATQTGADCRQTLIDMRVEYVAALRD